MKDELFVGIDVGSVACSVAVVDRRNQLIMNDYCFHRGSIMDTLRDLLIAVDWQRVARVAYNQKSADFFNDGKAFNDQVALIEGALFQQGAIGSMFSIGGESFGLILFKENQKYQKP